MVGAQPLWLTAGFVIEEGFPVADLRRIVASMGAAARAAGVAVVAGDTKVVERGKADGLYVTTAGVGTLADGVDLGPHRVRPGDRVLLSGTLADHGMAVMVARGDLQLEAEIESDTAAVHELAAGLVALGPALRWMRDPTRGGLATALNELAEAAGLAVVLDETRAAGAAGGQRRLRDPRHRPALRRERGQADRGRRRRSRRRGARHASRASPRCGRRPARRGTRRACGARPARHDARRQPHRRHARRRSAAADLLQSRSRRQTRRRPVRPKSDTSRAHLCCAYGRRLESAGRARRRGSAEGVHAAPPGRAEPARHRPRAGAPGRARLRLRRRREPVRLRRHGRRRPSARMP